MTFNIEASPKGIMTDSVTSHNENLGGEQSSPSAEVEELFARLDRWIPAGQLADRAKLRQVFDLAAKADEYRVEADCGLRDFDQLEVTAGILEDGLREIAQGRRNKPFDPWAREVASRTLTSALANPASATGDSGAVPDSVPSGDSVTLIEIIREALAIGRARAIANAIADEPEAHTLAAEVAAAQEPFNAAIDALAVLELRESDRQSSESRDDVDEFFSATDWLDSGSASALEVTALRSFWRTLSFEPPLLPLTQSRNSSGGLAAESVNSERTGRDDA